MARKYKPATFQPTIRPDWGGVLSYIPDDEKINILEALIKYPSVECKSKFWIETIKPDLDLQYDEFTRQCAAKSRGVRNRWGKTSITTLKDENKTSTTGVIVSERERIGIEERIRKIEDKKKNKNNLDETKIKPSENLAENDNINIIINKLKNILVNYHKRDFSIRNWRDSVDKMLRIDKVPFDDVIKCLDWYAKHIGEDFVPVVASGSSLREKYVKLENAVKRDLPKDNIQNFIPDAKRDQESRLARMAELTKIESMKRVQQKYGV